VVIVTANRKEDRGLESRQGARLFRISYIAMLFLATYFAMLLCVIERKEEAKRGKKVCTFAGSSFFE
jgi:hypothetical protein